MTQQQGTPPSVADVFETIADSYDQTGVEFFKPVGERLVSLLDPQPGERCLDIGCGRGAVTVPLALATGPSGSVDAVDVSAAMVAATRALVETAGLDHVRVAVADAADLTGRQGAYDVVASSLVLFFLREPAEALRSWAATLVPGGRIGLTTFGGLDDATEAIDALFEPWLPAPMRDARTSGKTGPFASDSGMEDVFGAAGIEHVRTVAEPAVLEFDDLDAWRRFMLSTGQRAMWQHVPEPERPGFLERVGDILDGTRLDGGRPRLVWRMRYTLGTA